MADIMRHRPFMPMQSLRREMDRLFGEFLPGFGEEGSGEFFSTTWAPRLDLSETSEAYLVKMDLPGIEKENVSVTVEGHQLTVRGERKEEKKTDQENVLRMERSYGSFYRSISLPKAAQVDAVKATFKNGVLEVHVPKAEEKQGRHVEIE